MLVLFDTVWNKIDICYGCILKAACMDWGIVTKKTSPKMYPGGH